MTGFYLGLFGIVVAACGYYLYTPVPQGAMGEDWIILSVAGIVGKVTRLQTLILQKLGNSEWVAKNMRFQMKTFRVLMSTIYSGAIPSDDVTFHDDVYAGIPVRIYMPKERRGSGAVMYIHGGGWVRGSVEQSQPTCTELARKLQRVVVSIDYRLAPEHPYPAGMIDCETAVRHFIDHAHSRVKVDPKKVVVGGESAGGNLAAVMANRLHAKPAKHQLNAQLLIYPVTQMTDFQLASYKHGHNIEMAGNASVLTTQAMANFFCLYLGLSIKYSIVLLANQHVHPSLTAQPQYKFMSKSTITKQLQKLDELQHAPTFTDSDSVVDLRHLASQLDPEDVEKARALLKPLIFNPDVNPMYFESLAGVAPAYVITSGFDVLRDDGTLYVNRLREAGVATVWKHYPQAIHGIFGLKTTKLGKQVMDEAVAYLNEII